MRTSAGVKETLYPVTLQMPIRGCQPLEEPLVRITRLVVGCKGHPYGRQTRPLHLASQVDVGARHLGIGKRNVNVIVGVDPDRLGNDFAHSWIASIRRLISVF